MSCVEVVVRAAGGSREESAARAALVRRGLRQAYPGAVLYFICQELTLQACVLCGAVVFIFAGGGAAACGALLPAAALLVSAAVAIAHAQYARQKHQDMCSEEAGWVAEALSVRPGSAPPGALRIRLEGAQAPSDLLTHQLDSGANTLVGTVSLSRHRAAPYRRIGYVHALAVHPLWQRRGVARALAGAARAWAAARGFESLEAHTTELAPAARACLHDAGWQLRGSFQRPIVWSALTLPVTQLTLPLPYA